MDAEAHNELNTSDAPAVQAQRHFSVWRQCRGIFGLHPKRLGALLMRAYSDWSADNATRLGAALAYYTLFSIAPVLIVVTGIAGIVIGRSSAHAQISPWLERFLSPDGARAAELMLEQHVTATGGVVTTVIGFVTLFLATSAFVNELRQSMNLVWRVQTPPSQEGGILSAVRDMFTTRLYAFVVAVGAAVLVVLSMLANATIAVAASYFHSSLPLPAVVLHMIHFVISFLLMTVIFALVYKTLPDAYVAWGDAWAGAVFTALLFDVGSLVLSTFVAQASGSPYGTATSVLALLVWVYYSAQVFFFGAELTRIFATTIGGGIVPVHRSLAPALRRRRIGPSSSPQSTVLSAKPPRSIDQRNG